MEEGSTSEKKVTQEMEEEEGNSQRPEAETTQGVNLLPATAEFLENLHFHVTSRHGQSRSKKEAGAICTEVVKCLKFQNAQPQPEDLLDPNRLDSYLSSLGCEVSAATQVAKLNRIRTGIVLSKPQDKISRIFTLIKNWSASLNKQAKKKNRERLEDLSENPPGFEDTEEFVESPALSRIFDKAVSATKKGQAVPQLTLTQVTHYLAGALLLTNHQRPSAITSMTIKEYKKAQTTREGREQ